MENFMEDKLFLYGFYSEINGQKIVKFGQTLQKTEEEARFYVAGQTIGKFKGIITLDNIIFCEDFTDFLLKSINDGNFMGKPPKFDKFDNFVRNKIKNNPIHTGIHIYDKENVYGQKSEELHIYDKTVSDEDIKNEWVLLLNQIKYGNLKKRNYNPNPHQIEGSDKASEYFQSITKDNFEKVPNQKRRFLFNHKMRSGKNMTTYLTINKLNEKKLNVKKVLIVTSKPNDTKNGWEDETDHVLFSNFKFRDTKNCENPKFSENEDVVEILFASFQDVIGEDGNKLKWEYIKKQNIDLLIIDETHYGSETYKAKNFLNSLNSKYTLHLSGTPIKALMGGLWGNDQISNWTYMDEQKAKQDPYPSLGKNPYSNAPKMDLYIMDYDENLKKEYKKTYSSEEEPTMLKIFEKENLTKIFIEKLYNKNGPFKKFLIQHSIWYLPSIKACNLLEKLLNKDPFFKDVSVINVSGENEDNLTVVKNIIKTSSRSIILTCGRFTTGTTFEDCDTVLMLSNTKSCEGYFQTIFRGGTENEGKKSFRVFDFDYDRVLEVFGKYSEALSEVSHKTQKEVLREMLDTIPIHSFNESKHIKINEEEILNYFYNNRKVDFESNYLFDTEKLNEKVFEILRNEKETNNFSSVYKLNENSEEKRKTYKSTPTTRESKFKEKIDDWVAKARTITKKLPYFIFLNDDIKNLEDIGNFADSFQEIIQISYEDFVFLIDCGFINYEHLDSQIKLSNFKLNLYES